MVHETCKFLKLIGFVVYFTVHFVLNLSIIKKLNSKLFNDYPKKYD